MRQHRILKSGGLVVSFLLLAILITWPAFSNGNFKTSFDAMVHLTRWESIYQALKSGQLPPLVNMIGFRQEGSFYRHVSLVNQFDLYSATFFDGTSSGTFYWFCRA